MPLIRRFTPEAPMYDIDFSDPDCDSTSPGENALAFLLRTAPLATPARGTARQLEIVAFVGEEVVEVRQVASGQMRGFTIALGCDLVDPTAPDLIRTGADPASPQLVHDGRGWVFLPTFDMVAFVDTGADEPERRVVTGETALSAGDRLLVEIGPVIYVIQEVQPSKRVPGEALAIDTPMLSLLSFLGISAGLFGYALGTVPPPPESNTMGLVESSIMIDLARIKPPPPAPKQKAHTESVGAHSGPEGRSHAGHPKPQGRPSDKDTAMNVFKGLGSVFASIGGTDLTPGVRAGIIGLQGTHTGNGPGFGLRGDDIGGGGHTDSVGIDRLSTRGEGDDLATGGTWKKKDEGPSVATGEAITIGALDPSEIDRVIKRNLASIRYCYQKELQSHPGIGGKVSVKFTIAADGSVSSATTRPTNPMPSVEACLTSRFLTLHFPEPKGGGVVLVSYPFVFSQG